MTTYRAIIGRHKLTTHPLGWVAGGYRINPSPRLSPSSEQKKVDPIAGGRDSVFFSLRSFPITKTVFNVVFLLCCFEPLCMLVCLYFICHFFLRGGK